MNASNLSTEFLARLRAFVRRRVRTEHDADDVVQDVLTKLIAHDAAVQNESIYAWLFTTARHAIIDRARKQRNDEPLPGDETIASEIAEDVSTTTELARCMEPMLASLDADDRALLQRVDMLGESQADIAREMGLSMSGLKSRVQRARGRLRNVLEECCAVERDRLGAPLDYQRRPDRQCPC